MKIFNLEKNIQNIYIKNDDIYELEFVLGNVTEI